MYDLIIIGAGPAGLTAAIYAGRYRLNTLVLEKSLHGGQIVLSPAIDNFPGFPGGISTHELAERFKKQVDELGVNIEIEEVEKISVVSDSESCVYNIKAGHKVYETKTVIIATGAQPKKCGVKGEDKFIGKGVSYCGTCDGPLFKDKNIAVIGGGDRAVEEAIFLASYAKKVSLIHRRESLRASKILEERARRQPKIIFVLESEIEEIIGQNKVAEIKIKNVKNDSHARLPCDGVFIFIGIQPNTAFLKNLLTMDVLGFIAADENLQTSMEGVFACGDCRKKSLYQVVTACSDGAIAAASAQRYLLTQ